MIPKKAHKMYSDWIRNYPESSSLPISVSNRIFHNEEFALFKKIAKQLTDNKIDIQILLNELIDYHKI